MNCASCGTANPPGHRFCGGCGQPLAARCPACGTEAPPGMKFCGACGAALAGPATAPSPAPAAAPTVARKVVTIVFADLIGSTALQERLDAEAVSRVMDRYHRAVRGPIEAHGGTVVQRLGDGVMCAFGVPNVAEDDAIRAVRAAVAVQQAFREFREENRLADRVGLRVAVNTGEVVVSDDYTAGIGDPLNVAAHLQHAAQDGDVLIGESTRRLVSELVTLAPIGALALKGRREAVAAYRVVSLDRPAGASATPFVGREGELRRLRAVYDAAVSDRRARLAVVLGSPGLGKSRVIAEVAHRLEDAATIVSARCDPSGGGTFAPLARGLRALVRLEDTASADAARAAIASILPGEDSEHDRIADGIAALLAGTPAPPEETFFAVRRFLGALARFQPVVLAIDDLHWAEPLLLDLTEHLVQWSTDTPLFVLVAARPELREERSSLVTPGPLVAEVVTLAGLDAGAATRLAANAIGAEELPAAVAGRVLAASEGNPLFVGELVRMLVHDGALVREGDQWTLGVELASLEMPPTIQALLAARIEKLRPEERTVLERASVVGRQFSRAAVRELLPRDAPDLDRQLEALRRSELIESDTGWFLGEPALRFHHALIRDAAYRRLLRNTRAELHAHFADWVVAQVGDEAPHDETIGWHLEQAHQHLRELGPVDAQGRALGERASQYLAAAGRRALARDDVPVAASLLGRALDRLEPADPARAELALDWCEALLAAGEVTTAEHAIEELGRHAGDSPRLRAWHTCFAGERASLTDPKALRTTADAVSAAAEQLTAAGDSAGEAKAHYVHAVALARLGRVGACEAALDRALAAARRGPGDRRRANAVLSGAPIAALWGPSPVTRASGRCLDVVRVLRITQGSPAVEAVALRCQGVLEALRGRSEAARRMIASSRRMVEELGITHRLLQADQFAGQVELIEGDPVAAERCLRTAYEGMRDLGLGSDAAQAAAQLGRALLAQDRAAEAEALSHESEALSGDDLHSAIAWRGVRAEALARRGEPEHAVELARAAVELASATDALLWHADARTALAAALRAAGRGAEAAAEEARAAELWEAKGATLLAERARREGARAVPIERATAAPTVRRRVQENAATEFAVRTNAAIAARDLEAVVGQHSDAAHFTHLSGIEMDRHGIAEWWRLFFADDAEGVFNWTPLASLGESIALLRNTWGGSASAGAGFESGAFEVSGLVVVEADRDCRAERMENFAPDRLSDAIVHLYERHAELLPEGPERTRAAATARSVAMLMRELPDRWPFAPDVELVDHRSVGIGSVRGAEAIAQSVRAMLGLTDENATRVDDVFALRPDALVVLRTHLGTDRATGGAFERPQLTLFFFGPDGLVTRWERFDPGREAEALARFDALTAPTARPARRVRPNAATGNASRVIAAMRARDFAAYRALYGPDCTEVDHRSGRSIEVGEKSHLQQVKIWSWSKDPTIDQSPLATLGDSLALTRASRAGTGYADDSFDVGGWESNWLNLIEVDGNGLQRRQEVFDVDHLGDAIARLYERHAELLPEGPERTRAAAIARLVAALAGPPQSWPLVPDIEFFDHRTVGVGSVSGAEGVERGIRAFFELVEDYSGRWDDVLALRPDALVIRGATVGTLRMTGGEFERLVCQLYIFSADGRLARWEQFDAERAADALARLDALTAAAPPPRSRRPVRANGATANATRIENALAAKDMRALEALVAEGCEVVDHGMGATYGREGLLATWRTLLSAENPTVRHDALATLGDSLALARVARHASGFVGRNFDVGPYEREEIFLMEVDAQERRSRLETFKSDRLRDAVARLYERYAERMPEGPERTRATETARSVAAGLNPLARDRYAASLAPDVELVDHRTLATLSATGAKAVLEGLDGWREVADDISIRHEEILGLHPHALAVRAVFAGVVREGGGAFERPTVTLVVWGPEGRLSRIELFDDDREAEALARFDELVAPRARAHIVETAATRAFDRFGHAWSARDWNALTDDHARGFRYSDRRPMMRLDLDLEQWLEFMRPLFDMSSARISSSAILATRGERLELNRLRVEVADETIGPDVSIGPSETESLIVSEVDADGRRVASVRFDADALDAAYAELDARYAAGEAAEHREMREALARVKRAIETRNWDDLASCFSPEFVREDHRLLGWGSHGSTELYVAAVRSLVELRPDAFLRRDHVELADRTALVVTRWIGAESDGAFEIPYVLVFGLGPDGRIRREEAYDLEQLPAARARFAELAAPRAPARLVETAATRASERFDRTWATRDWEAIAALHAPGFRYDDRLVHLDLDRERWLAFVRTIFDLSAIRISSEVVATRGDRLALIRSLVEVADGSIGPSEIASVAVTEIDRGGRRLALVRFDPDQLDAAYAELDARYAAGEAAEHPAMGKTVGRLMRALSTRKWERLDSVIAPDFVQEDHRRLGLATLHSREEYVGWVRSLTDMRPDVAGRVEHVDLEDRAALIVAGWTGSEADGAFEIFHVGVLAAEPDGQICRWDVYGLDQLDAALARFEELRPDPLRIPPNAATRAVDRFGAAVLARDWQAVESCFAPGFGYEDRRRGIRDSGDRAKMLASVGVVASIDPQVSIQTLATAGDRLALQHHLFTISGGDAGVSEIEALQIAEVDVEGRLVATIVFDPDDRRAAAVEMLDRTARSETSYPAASLEARRALLAHDLARLRATLPDDFLFHDHRRTGGGLIEGADGYVAWMAALFELSPDVIIEPLYEVAAARHGVVSVAHTFGTLADGGGKFELALVQLARFEGDLFVGAELFELDDLDRALVRFEELRPDPLRIPPNAATRARDRMHAALEAEDWAKLRALASDDLTFDDRSKQALVTGGVEEWFETLRFFRSEGARATRELIGTAGDRIALERIVRTRAPESEGGPFEIEFILLAGVDAEGRLCTSIRFEPDDRRAAFEEAQARFVAGEAAAIGGQAPVAAFDRAFARDSEALRTCIAADAVICDRGSLSLLGTLDRDQYVESVNALADLAPDLAVESLRILCWNGRGRVDLARRFGTRDGGRFENFFARVFLTAGDCIQRFEMFDAGATDAALARFAELCADS